jgi:hypothetical protein
MSPKVQKSSTYKLDEATNEEYPAITLTFTSRDVRRCIQALDWYIDSFADAMIESNFDGEVARFEDLLYRFMGVPEENMKLHVASRVMYLTGGTK